MFSGETQTEVRQRVLINIKTNNVFLHLCFMPIYHLLLHCCLMFNLPISLSTLHFSSLFLLTVLLWSSEHITHMEQSGRTGALTGLLCHALPFQVTS